MNSSILRFGLVVACLTPVLGCQSRERKLESFISDLGSRNGRTRENAVVQLGILCRGSPGSSLVPRAVKGLEECLRDPESEVRHKAASSLGEIGAPAADSLPALADALQDDNPAVRTNAAFALFEIAEDANGVGRRSRDILPKMKKALVDRDPYVRAHLVRGLIAMSKEETTLRLIASLATDNSPDVREQVGLALGRAGEASKPYIDLLGKIQREDEDESVRVNAAGAIEQIQEKR